MKIIDTKIDQFANYLQQRNNLDRIQFLKVRLGMQVVVSNIAKFIVTYGLALIFHVFWYTLVTHIAYMILRFYAHGAHAKSSILCHIQNILIFLIMPWLIVKLSIGHFTMLLFALIGYFIVITYAPAATKKQPIPKRLVKRKRILSIVLYIILVIISFIVKEPYSQLILFGLIVESTTLLPIFFPKEDYYYGNFS
ncbi:accessory gene regulator AgrB [Staphylococcus pasteuri]|uniref:accessory gene regulator AgrB n=1 Tax=Staphylococcus TaxID=1279 RepID=UPI0008A2196A|nr:MULTISPECIES: accessory gene regulator AgrB [Staphylococcus]RQX27806.1 histidine kinase [Staphylococcus warneri]MCO0862346.1 accessory gene regulator AgrB [Staphylococcus pasteuri]MCO5361083.1 accessory gene regulator AgrB [Staphylococcus pasteuri]OFV10669.1 histidine kinase [Staphylococcus sp. HMSC13A10]UXR68193.1 accessory gene regulator AgrB [Staphylococcus pasteuri]